MNVEIYNRLYYSYDYYNIIIINYYKPDHIYTNIEYVCACACVMNYLLVDHGHMMHA